MRGGTVQINWHETKPILTLDFHPLSGTLATGGADYDIKVSLRFSIFLVWVLSMWSRFVFIKLFVVFLAKYTGKFEIQLVGIIWLNLYLLILHWVKLDSISEYQVPIWRNWIHPLHCFDVCVNIHSLYHFLSCHLKVFVSYHPSISKKDEDFMSSIITGWLCKPIRPAQCFK